MAVDQPDWQRFQSSNGPPLATLAGGSPLDTGIMYVGPWRSWFMAATITGGTGVWTITTTFYADAAGTITVATATSIVGGGQRRIGWQPVVAQYMRTQAVLTLASAGDALSVVIVPSILDSPQATRIVNTPYLVAYEQLTAKLTQAFYFSAYIMPGPATLLFRANQYSLIIDVQQMTGTATFTNIVRLENAVYNQAVQYNILLPDTPIRVVAFNAEAHADATYDILLSPA